MAIAFPQNPEDGNKYTVGGIVYEYSDGAWRLSSDNSKASIHVGTTPPDKPQQGDLWFHSGEADLKIYYVDSTSSQWVPASSPPDPYEENFVSISGDTMTGILSFQRGSKNNDQFKISPNSAEDYNTNIYSLNNGVTRFRTSHTEYESDHVGSHIIIDPDGGVPTTKIYKLVAPTNPDMAANKQYVDDAIAEIKSDHEAPVGVPGTPYKYVQRYGDNLADGEFHIEGNGAVQLSRKSLDGVEMSHYSEADYSASVRCMVIVRADDGRVLHAISTKHIYVEGSNRRIRHSKDTISRDGKSEMVEGQTYWVTDGFFNF